MKFKEFNKYVVWGFKPSNGHYTTHTHIHEGFYRSLKMSGENVVWLDEGDDISSYDFSGATFITEHRHVTKRHVPLRDDCFYFVHGDLDITRKALGLDKKNWLVWDVFVNTSRITPDIIWLDKDMPFFPERQRFDMRWATDLIPSEIEQLKPSRVWNPEVKVINYVGSLWHVNQIEIARFSQACKDDGITFDMRGAGQRGIISVEENIRLMRESKMAPAISGSHHLIEGYAPCRIFKNISYGCYGITNSQFVTNLFEVPVIFHEDPYKLYAHAKESLAAIPLAQLHELIDEVARKHTYLNRLEGMRKAARIRLGWL